MSNLENIYLTGSTGYLGHQLVKDLASSKDIAKIYTPIRSKHGSSGKHRYEKSFGDFTKTKFFNFYEPIPDDVTTAIFSGYSVNFERSLYEFMLDNQFTLQQIKELDSDKTKKVIFVSTAYVKGPGDNSEDDPVFNEEVNVLFDRIMKNQLTLQDVGDTVKDRHLLTNAYLYSKALMEQLLTTVCLEKQLTLSIVRPSQITVSSDGQLGTLSNYVGASFLGFKRILNAVISSRHDTVYLDFVSKGIINLIKMENPPKIFFLTSGDNAIPITQSAKIYKNLILFGGNTYLYQRCKLLNRVFLSVFFPGQLKYYDQFYKNYEYFMSNEWSFPTTFSINSDHMIKMIDKYVRHKDKVIMNQYEQPKSFRKRLLGLLSILLLILIKFRISKISKLVRY